MIDVIVTIIGTQRDAQGEESKIELTTVGRYYKKNGIDYIIYQDSEITGLEGTNNMLKIYNDQVILVRMGSVQHKQIFCLGKKHSGPYITPFGGMNMGILTNHINIDMQGASGHIDISYDLEVNNQWQSANTLSIQVMEERKSGH